MRRAGTHRAALVRVCFGEVSLAENDFRIGACGCSRKAGIPENPVFDGITDKNFSRRRVPGDTGWSLEAGRAGNKVNRAQGFLAQGQINCLAVDEPVSQSRREAE